MEAHNVGALAMEARGLEVPGIGARRQWPVEGSKTGCLRGVVAQVPSSRRACTGANESGAQLR